METQLREASPKNEECFYFECNHNPCRQVDIEEESIEAGTTLSLGKTNKQVKFTLTL